MSKKDVIDSTPLSLTLALAWPHKAAVTVCLHGPLFTTPSIHSGEALMLK